MSVLDEIIQVLERGLRNLFRLYFSPIDSILYALAPRFHARFPRTFQSYLPRPVDERIAHIDTARASLETALSALGELKEEATQRKTDLENLLSKLQQAQVDHESKALRLKSIKRMTAEEVSSFQQLAGITNKNVERLVGFLGGVIASLIAATIWKLLGL